MYMLSTLGQVDHNRPKIHQPSLQRLVGTRPGFNPLQGHTRTLRRFSYGLNRETGEAVLCPNLHWWNLLKTDAQSALRDKWRVDNEVPGCQRAC
jgi:hypothetical protein